MITHLSHDMIWFYTYTRQSLLLGFWVMACLQWALQESPVSLKEVMQFAQETIHPPSVLH